MKILDCKPKSAIIQLEISDEETDILWKALVELEDTHPTAGSDWKAIIRNALDIFFDLHKEFERLEK
jgi:hypothetical protein